MINKLQVSATDDHIPLILDTDIGIDIDDTWALAMLLGQPRIDLKLIATAFNNTPEKTRLVAKILQQTDHMHIPIGTGIQTCDEPINQSAWLGNYELSQYPGVVHEDGIEAMINGIRNSTGLVTLLVIGPSTNIAEALRRAPDIVEKVRIVAMAGSIYRAHADFLSPIAEYNITNDIEAFRAVLAAPWDVTLSPLDGCGRIVLSGKRYERVKQSETTLARVVMENYEMWTHRQYHPADSSSILFDTVAAYLVMDTALCKIEDLALSVNDEGFTVPDANGRVVHCQMGWNDQVSFENLLVNCLTL